MMDRLRLLPWLGALFIAILTALIYQNGVAGPWLFDDYPNLQPLLNSRESGWAGLFDRFVVSSSGLLGRPVSMLSFIFSAMTSGDNLAGWKWFNVVLHLLTGLAFMWLACRLLEDLGGWDTRRARLAGLLVGALWLLHPLHVSTVLYTVQRMTILSAMFCAIGLGLYLSGRRALQTECKGWARISLALLLCWPLATLSKENGALLGAYVLLLESMLPALNDRSIKNKIKGLLCVTVVIPMLLAAAYMLIEPRWLIGGYHLRDFTLTERLLTEARVVWNYVLWVGLPIQSHMGFMHDDVVISTGLTTPLTTLWSIAGWALLLPCLWLLRRSQPLAVLGILLFMASQLMESTIIPLELVYEHRTYFGSFGLLLVVVAVLGDGLKQPLLRGMLALLVLLLFAALTLMRAQTWSDRDSLYMAMWRAHPQSPRMVTTFAAQFARNGEFEQAWATLEKSRDPRTQIAGLYVLCLRDAALTNQYMDSMGVPPPARMTDYYLSALVAVAILGLDGQCAYDSRRFAALLDRVMTPANISGLERYKLLIYKAHHLHAAGELMKAIQALNAAADLLPSSLIPLSLETEWFIEAGNRKAAMRALERLRVLVQASEADFSERMIELEQALGISTVEQPAAR